MRTALTFVSLLAAFFVLVPQERVDAQVTTATFLGLVHDSSGAVVPGATVVATNRGTGVPREAVTDARGEFVLSALPNGPYSIRIEMPGFKTLCKRGNHSRCGPDRAADVRARARHRCRDGYRCGSGSSDRNRHIQRVGDARIAGSARTAGEPPQCGESAEPRAWRLGGRFGRRNGEHEWCRRRRHGHQRRRDRSELQPRGTRSQPLRRPESDLGYGPRLGRGGPDRERRPSRRIRRSGGRPGQHDQPVRHERLPRHCVLQPAKFQVERAQRFCRPPPSRSGRSISTAARLVVPIFRNRLFFFATYEGYRENVQLDLIGNTPNQQTRDALLAASAVC